MISQPTDNRRHFAALAMFLLISLTGMTGCSVMRETHHVADLAKRTAYVEPRFFDYLRSEKLAQREARMIAEQAWGEVAASGTVANVSLDFQNGFTEGFADYLYRGGDGEPPVIPPRGYWNLRFLNSPGKHSINDWYKGFRQGVQSCKASGLRSMWVIPTSLLGGGLDDDGLPESQDQLWSANPQNFVPQAAPQHTPAQESLMEPEEAPTPTPPTQDSDDVSEDKPSQNVPSDDSGEDSSTDDLPPADDATDSTDEPDLADLLAPNTDASNDDPIDAGFGGNDTEPENPFGDDSDTNLFGPSTDEAPIVPQATTPEGPTANEDDIFGSPSEAFESTDSFKVDDLEFDFESSQTQRQRRNPVARDSDRTLQMGRVSPASKIPSYSTKSQDTQSILVTSGLYDDDFPLPPEGLELITSSETVPKPARQRPAAIAASVAEQANLAELRFNEPRTNNQATSAVESSVQNMAPIGMRIAPRASRPQEPPAIKIASRPSSEPVTMWIDDGPPSKPQDTTTPIVVSNADWDPFGEIEAMRSQQAQKQQAEPRPQNQQLLGPPLPVRQRQANAQEVEGFYEVKTGASQRITNAQSDGRWKPDRKELPLRVTDKRIKKQTLTPQTKFYGQPIPQPHLPSDAGGSSLKLGKTNDTEKLPRIYFGGSQGNEIKSVDNDALEWKFDE